MAAAASSSPSVPAGPPGAPAGNIPPGTGDQGPLAEAILPARRGSSGCYRDEGTEGSQQPLSGTGRPSSFSGSPYTALPGRRPRLSSPAVWWRAESPRAAPGPLPASAGCVAEQAVRLRPHSQVSEAEASDPPRAVCHCAPRYLPRDVTSIAALPAVPAAREQTPAAFSGHVCPLTWNSLPWSWSPFAA